MPSEAEEAAAAGIAAKATVTPNGTDAAIFTSGLTAGTYKVLAVDAAGNMSLAGTEVSIITLDTAPPSPPASVTANAQGQDVIVSWSASGDNVGIAGYRVYMSSAYEGLYAEAGSVDGETCTLTIGNAGPDSTLYFYVIAFDLAGNESAASEIANAVTGGLPYLPAAFCGRVTDAAGNPVLEGTVEVIIDGQVKASQVFTDGWFGQELGTRLLVDKNYYMNAGEIRFEVNSQIAEVSPQVDWGIASGNLTEINLVIAS
jgi:hypothetical protein